MKKELTTAEEIDEIMEDVKRLSLKCIKNRRDITALELEHIRDRNDLLLAHGRLTSRLNDLI
jgi:hypothetical protein